MIEQIQEDLKQAMRAKDTTKLNVLRALKTAITNTRIAKYPGNHQEMSESEIIQIVRKEVSKRQDSVNAYINAQRHDLILIETNEIEVLNKYLPVEWSDEELTTAVEDAIRVLGAISKKDMGKVIKEVVAVSNGGVDNKRISSKVGELLK
jgi:uncharacterized protein YqeY